MEREDSEEPKDETFTMEHAKQPAKTIGCEAEIQKGIDFMLFSMRYISIPAKWQKNMMWMSLNLRMHGKSAVGG